SISLRLERFRKDRSERPDVLARALLDDDRAADALEVATQGLKTAPRDPALMIAQGRAQLALGDTLAAEATLLQAVRADPKSVDALRWLATLLIRRGDPARAVKALERAIAIDP